MSNSTIEWSASDIDLVTTVGLWTIKAHKSPDGEEWHVTIARAQVRAYLVKVADWWQVWHLVEFIRAWDASRTSSAFKGKAPLDRNGQPVNPGCPLKFWHDGDHYTQIPLAFIELTEGSYAIFGVPLSFSKKAVVIKPVSECERQSIWD